MRTRTLLVSAFFFPLSAFAGNQDVKSAIDRVTVFRDRAEIERLAHVELASGANTLIFSSIPQTLDADSLKVSGLADGDLQLVSVQHKTRYFEQDRSAEVQAIQLQIDELDKKTKTLVRRKIRLEGQSKRLNEIKLDQEIPTSEHVLTPRSSKEIHDLLILVSSTGEKLDAEIDGIENELDATAKTLALLKMRMSQFGSAKKSESVVEVKLSAKNTGKADVRLAYQVGGASWIPDYNLQRTSSKKGQEFSLETFGNIAQSTGENWDDVEVILSTARPQLGIARPALSPITLNLIQQAMERQAYASGVAAAPAPMLSIGKLERRKDNAASFGAELDDAIQQVQQADIEQGEVVTYHIKSRISLKSDGSAERIKITQSALQGNLLNVAVPAQLPYVFMEGRFKNGKQPLLAGIVNVFSNGNYVGKQSLSHVPVSKDFQLALGISNDLTIERVRTKDFEDDAGLIRSLKRLTREYSIRAQNQSETEQSLVILEARPVSQNEKITAQLTELTLKSLDPKDAARIERNAGILEWHVKLAAGTTQDVNYRSTVEFSPDDYVTGIERL